MSITSGRAPEKTRRHVASATSRPGLVEVLLACGVLYPLTYVVANDLVAATLYDGYSRMDQAISELSATGAPTRIFLVAMLASIFYLVIGAFGVPFVLSVLIVAYQDLKLRDRQRRGVAP